MALYSRPSASVAFPDNSQGACDMDFSPWAVYRKGNNLFFYNKDTQSTSIISPPEYVTWRNKKVNEQLELHYSNWRCHYDEKKGRNYYYEKTSKKTQWNAPTEVESFEPMIEALSRDDFYHGRIWSIPSDFDVWNFTEINRYLQSIGSLWRCMKHKDGRRYYTDTSSQTVQWGPLDVVKEYESFLIEVMVDLSDKKDEYPSIATTISFETGNHIPLIPIPKVNTNHSQPNSARASALKSPDAEDNAEANDALKQTDYFDQFDRNYIEDEYEYDNYYNDYDNYQQSLTSQPQPHLQSQSQLQQNFSQDDIDEDFAIDITPPQVRRQDDKNLTNNDQCENGDVYGRYEDHTPVAAHLYQDQDHATEMDWGDDEEYLDRWEGQSGESTHVPMGIEYEMTGHDKYDNSDRNYADSSDSDIKVDNDGKIEDTVMILETALDYINQHDSLLEPDIIATMQTAIRLTNESPLEIVKRLCNSYRGYAQMILAVLEFHKLVARITLVNNKNDLLNETKVMSIQTDFDPESLLCKFISDITKHHFNKSSADSLLYKLVGIPSWLTMMINDPIPRASLIDLYDRNKGSELLGLCLREISALGFHREISKVIHEVDFFEIYNNMVADMFVSIATAKGSELFESLEDLKRMCCHSEYMYLYTNDSLVAIESTLYQSLTSSNQILLTQFSAASNSELSCSPEVVGSSSFNQFQKEVWQRLRRLREELEKVVVWEKREAGAGRLTNSAIMALFVIGTYIEPNKRLRDSYGMTGDIIMTQINIMKEIREVLKLNKCSEDNVNTLCAHYYNVPVDKWGMESSNSICTPETISYIYTNRLMSNDLIRNPQFLSILVDVFSNPVRKLSTKFQSSLVKILCFATILDDVPTIPSESELIQLAAQVNAIERCLVQVKDICNELVKLAYGVLTYDKVEEVVKMMVEPLVSLCVLRWILLCIQDTQLNSKDVFLILLPSFFQMITTSATYHPFQRDACFEIVESILSLSSLTAYDGDREAKKTATDAYTLMSAQRDASTVLVYLMGMGLVLGALDLFARKADELDAVTLRHFLYNLLASVSPPYSVSFLEKLAGLLSKPSVKKAVISVHFNGQSYLSKLVDYCNSPNGHVVSDALNEKNSTESCHKLKSVIGDLLSTAQV